MNMTTVKLASGAIPEAAKTSPLNGHRLALLLLVLAYTLSIADRMILSKENPPNKPSCASERPNSALILGNRIERIIRSAIESV